MNISYTWLTELVDLSLSADELAKSLTRVGLAVEGIHTFGDDRVFDIDLTSNRPDCLSHLGVAREVGAITDAKLKRRVPEPTSEFPDVPIPALLAADVVKIDDTDLCTRFTARVIRNVKIGPSPDWLVKRLEALGERSINNVADITNYVMLELGQPMHAFDLDKLTENRIVVRRAKNGEIITTLDDVERKLDESMLAICDAERPVAVAGIMGGLDSSIIESTVNVLLEVACFDRGNIRHTSRKLNLATEASYRFERGVDIENVKAASQRAADLIAELAGGEEAQFVDVYPSPASLVEVTSPDIAAAVKRLTGLEVADAECERILAALGIKRESVDQYTAPSWRHDIANEEDLVEEIARHSGYENIREELPPAFSAGEYQPSETKKRVLRQALTDIGYDEAITYSFIDEKWDTTIAPVPGLALGDSDNRYVTLRDSVIEGAVRMRPTLLPGLISALRLNLNQQRRNIKLFEIGKVFAANRSEDGLPAEREAIALIITGGEMNEGRGLPARELDFYDVKGAVESVIAAVGVAGVSYAPADAAHLKRGQSAVVSIGETNIGYIGRLNEEISSDYKFKQPVYVAEIDLQAAFEAPVSPVVYTPLSKYPGVTRDVSFLVDRSVSFAMIRKAIVESGIELCRNVIFVDLYEGKGLGDDQRSVTVGLEYRSDERTLIEDEVNDAHERILRFLETTLGIRPRF
ncbi:MAG: phenylalanine--tRNA ligase subunit beta [Acidobacteriota bacterium]